MYGTRPRSGVSPTYNVLLDRKTTLNPTQIDKNENENRDISLSEQHNQILSHINKERQSRSYSGFRACLMADEEDLDHCGRARAVSIYTGKDI